MAGGLFIQRWGSGRPVLFLHGLGASGRYWERVRKAAGDSYAGTAPDLLGFGRSPAPEDATYDVDCHVDALTPEVTPGSLVVAHSTGGIVALRLSARRPDLVASLLLIGLPAFPSEEVAREEVGRLGLMARLTVDGNPLAKRACELMCRFRPLAAAWAPFLIRDLSPSIASDATRHTWSSYHRTLERVVVTHTADDDLAKTAAPVLLVHGRDDRTAPLQHVERLALRDPNQQTRLRIVDGDHHVALRRPDEIARCVATALRSLPGTC